MREVAGKLGVTYATLLYRIEEYRIGQRVEYFLSETHTLTHAFRLSPSKQLETVAAGTPRTEEEKQTDSACALRTPTALPPRVVPTAPVFTDTRMK